MTDTNDIDYPKWLEFRVEEESCPHPIDIYDGCPLCRIAALEDATWLAGDNLFDLISNQHEQKQRIAGLEADITAMVKHIARLERELEDNDD